MNEKMSEPPCQSQGYLANAPDCIPCLFTIILKIILIRLRKKCHTLIHFDNLLHFPEFIGRRNNGNIDVGDRRNLLVTTIRSWWRLWPFWPSISIFFTLASGTIIGQMSPSSTNRHHFQVNNGYVDVGDGYWRRNVLTTDLMHRENHQHNEKSRQHIGSVTNI